MSTRPPGAWRTGAARWLVLVLVVVGGGCGGSSASAPAGTTVAGFPLGSFSKDVTDPQIGRVRYTWTFGPDGRWVEVPVALDGQAIPVVPVRGTFSADARTVTLATDFPPDFGTSRHGWRRDGDLLWTFFIDSTNPGDQEWFESLDSQPWTPATS